MVKGQVTIFVIVGLAILIGVGAFLFFTVNSTAPTGEELRDNPEVSPLIRECVQRSLIQARPTLAMQGGYIVVPEPQSIIEGIAIPVLSEEIQFSTLEEQIELLLDAGLYTCVLAKEFPGFDGDVFEKVRSEAHFIGDYVRVQINYTYNQENYELMAEEKMYLLEPITIANKVIKSNLATGNNYVPINGIKTLYNVTIEYIPYGDATVYYLEKDEGYFAFAMYN